MSANGQTIPAAPAALMRSILQRIATGPELSKDISREEACAGMRCVLDGQVDPVQAGIFLIALRMKRETDDENRGLLEAVRETTRAAVAAMKGVRCFSMRDSAGSNETDGKSKNCRVSSSASGDRDRKSTRLNSSHSSVSRMPSSA